MIQALFYIYSIAVSSFAIGIWGVNRCPHWSSGVMRPSLDPTIRRARHARCPSRRGNHGHHVRRGWSSGCLEICVSCRHGRPARGAPTTPLPALECGGTRHVGMSSGPRVGRGRGMGTRAAEEDSTQGQSGMRTEETWRRRNRTISRKE